MQIGGSMRGDKRSTWLIGLRTEEEENIVVALSDMLGGRCKKGKVNYCS
jgi:hypothetical protein